MIKGFLLCVCGWEGGYLYSLHVPVCMGGARSCALMEVLRLKAVGLCRFNRVAYGLPGLKS